MAALTGKEIVRVTGSAERGYIVTYRSGDPDGILCKAFIAPQEEHPDFQIARAFVGGAPIAAPREDGEADIFRV